MRNATISKLRNSLSEYLARVRRGETVIVFDRDTPIARIEPVPPTEDYPEWAREAIRRGIMTPPRVRDDARLPPPVKIDPKYSLLDALLEERRSGR